jgi:hypothetical protein
VGVVDSVSDYYDWYSFSGTVGQQFTITYERLSGNLSFNADLYNTTGTQLIDSNDTSSSVRTYTYVVPSSGVYYVRGYGYSQSGAYRLTVTQSP